MATSCVRTAALIGAESQLVTVEAHVTDGLPATIVAGLPEASLRETCDRIRAAIVNDGEQWPSTKITVSLFPARLPKRGSVYDLAMAVAVLAAAGDLPEPPASTLFLAELGLDGRLRSVPGVLPAVPAGTPADVDTVVVATGDADDASSAPGITVISADSLTSVVAWLRGAPPPGRSVPAAPTASPSAPGREPDRDSSPARLFAHRTKQ